MICAPSEINPRMYFMFRPLSDGTYKELKVIVNKDKVISSLSDRLRADEMQWIRKNLFTGKFDELQNKLKLQEYGNA